MERITINISQDHIDNSDAGLPDRCMIANALRQQLDLDENATVSVVSARDIEIEGIKVLPAPSQRRSIGQKIHHFDEARKVKPFSFELELPEGFRARLNELRRWRRTAR